MSRFVTRHGRRFEVETLETGAAPAPRRKRAPAKETFAQIPHQRGMKLYEQIGGAPWVIMLELDQLIFKSFGKNPVRLTNQAFEAVGMPRSTKLRALRQLEGSCRGVGWN
jgi:hypothetical protein